MVSDEGWTGEPRREPNRRTKKGDSNRMKRILSLIMIAAGLVAVAQQPPQPTPTQPEKVVPKAPYDSTKAQLWAEKQKNFQMQANQITTLYQAQMKDLQDKYVGQVKPMTDWMADVRKANGWDDTYTWNSDDDTWTHTPKPAPPTPAPAPAKAPEKKK